MRMPGVPAAPTTADSGLPSSHASGTENSSLDFVLIEREFSPEPLSEWMGWRLRLLVGAALLGCVGILLLARALGESPQISANWRVGDQQQLELASSTDPLLKLHEGESLVALVARDGHRVAIDALTMQRSPRWLIDPTQRQRYTATQEAMSSAFRQGKVGLQFSLGETVEVTPQARGIGSLGPMFWLLCGLSLVVYLAAMVVMLARPSLRNLLYTLATLSQAANLALIATESGTRLSLLTFPGPQLSLPAHTVFDLVTAAGVMHAAALHPRRLPAAGTIGWLVWGGMAALLWQLSSHTLPAAWWWLQGSVGVLGLGAVILLTWSHTIEPHPFAIVMRRFAGLGVGAWAALTLAVTWSARNPMLQQQVAVLAPTLWSVFLGSLLVLLPFVSKSQQVVREFSLLAAISTIATALDLLFVAAFSFGQFASLTLALFLSLGLYSGARQWLLNQLRNQNVLTTERVFEKLYRIAREVEAHPERTATLLTQLLRDLFRPIEAVVIDKRCPATRITGNGSTLLIPVPDLPRDEAHEHTTIVIRFAHHGHRLFTTEDARLAERVVEQLRRAVAFDQAVEQGRSEERLRIAQDLHDDIGARLLTLMYKAQSPEMEDYVRHTLQDLKTLTRGLAAPNHPLSHAAAEWKADLTQRLAVAHMALGWSFSADCELSLSVVQWSALTRVMRELVSNVIAHSQARRVDIVFVLEDDRLDLSVSDNGIGRNPQAWSHGLGLGGVRKRVKQLGGEVEWRELGDSGICCRVRIRKLSGQPFDKA